LAVKIVFCSNL